MEKEQIPICRRQKNSTNFDLLLILLSFWNFVCCLQTNNTHRPLRELSTAFSMNSIIVCDLNLAHEPNENVP